MSNLTSAQKRALTWIEANAPVSMFPCDGSGPSLRFVKKLEKIGLVEAVGQEAGRFGFAKFALTDHGRALLFSSLEKTV